MAGPGGREQAQLDAALTGQPSGRQASGPRAAQRAGRPTWLGPDITLPNSISTLALYLTQSA